LVRNAGRTSFVKAVPAKGSYRLFVTRNIPDGKPPSFRRCADADLASAERHLLTKAVVR
jgi:hypothetical protein